MNGETIDALLIAWICAFLILKVLLIRKDGRLGWSLAAANAAIGTAYLFALGTRAWPPLGEADRALDAIRVAVAVSVSWSVWELVRARLVRRVRFGRVRGRRRAGRDGGAAP